MNLKELQKNWDAFGRADPLWAILTDPARQGGKWDREQFFTSGRREIAKVMLKADALGLPARRESALDFGCGVGRLTQALCAYFEHCHGVDIASSMIGLAREYNAYGDRCEYHLNTAEDLHAFSANTFDFVYSNIVLQHMEARYSSGYIREFVRVLRPQGLLVFQVPSAPRRPAPGPGRQAASAPMPDSAFCASLTGYPPFIRAVAGSQMSIPVTVRNISRCSWPSIGDSRQRYAVQLGNHWLTPQGATARWDDARQSLPFDLPPGASFETSLRVMAPHAGQYVLELDMVQEAVAWFKCKSSVPARIAAEIEPMPVSSPAVAGKFTPRMEMYGIPKEEVLNRVTSQGAVVLEILDDFSPGPEWISFQYFVTKS
jgi:Methyltransferase domain